jgi:hypothetical protein
MFPDPKKMFDSTDEENRRDFAKGARDSKKADKFDGFIHELFDALPSFKDQRKSKDKSYHAGWHNSDFADQHGNTSSTSASSGGGAIEYQGLFEQLPTWLKAVLLVLLSYPVTGFVGCIARTPLQSTPATYGQAQDVWLNHPALNAFSMEAVYVPLVLTIGFILSGTLKLMGVKNPLRILIIIFALLVVGLSGKTVLDASGAQSLVDTTIRTTLDSLFRPSSPKNSVIMREIPAIGSTIKPISTTNGKSKGQKHYVFAVPAEQWVQTSLTIEPNQVIEIHHFDSNEPVSVNIGGTTDTRLRKAGDILPYYTSTDCKRDRGVEAQVPYTCIQIFSAESIKLFAKNSVNVGVYLKKR